MRKTLVMDDATREMRVVYTDLWDGQHERTEYRVISGRGDSHVVRNMPEFDGRPVLGTSPSLYVKSADRFRDIPVWTQEVAVGPTVKTTCPKASNPRRKCALCAAETAA